jgi:hypothetical protein
MDWASVESVMASKVSGIRNLHVVTKHLDLDYFMMFSSASSAIGNIGQASYAAANAFMDTYAHARKAAGLKASINWGPWGEVGMAASTAGLANQLANIGVDLLAVEHGLFIIEQALYGQDTQFLVMSIAWAKYLKQFMSPAVPPPMFANVAGAASKKKSGGADGAWATKLASVPAARRACTLCKMIQDEVMTVLSVTDRARVGFTTPLSEFGLDSMMSIELKDILSNNVGAQLSGSTSPPSTRWRPTSSRRR